MWKWCPSQNKPKKGPADCKGQVGKKIIPALQICLPVSLNWANEPCEQTLGRTVMTPNNRNRKQNIVGFFFFPPWNGKSLLIDIMTKCRRERKHLKVLVSFNRKWQTYLLLSIPLASYFALMYMHSCSDPRDVIFSQLVYGF